MSQDTPGIYYALAYWIFSSVFIALNRKRLKGWRLYALSALFLITISSIMLATAGVDGWQFLLTMYAVFMILFLYVFTAAEMPWRKALYFTVRAFILGEFAASFEWQMVYYGRTVFGRQESILQGAIIFLLCHATVFTITILLERRYRENNDELNITDRDLIIVCLFGTFIYLLSNLSYATPNSPFSTRNVKDLFAIRTLADFGGIGLLYAYHMQLCEMHARMEKEYLHKLLHMQKENYRLSAESVELVNRKYHDLKHQIRLLRSEISSGDKLHYLDEMEQEIKSYEAQNKTGNDALDVLLTAKSIQCQNAGITLTCVADGKELSFLKPTDLSVLFGNALDNAFESAEKIEDPEKRLIHLSVARQKQFVRIRVENCCEGEIRFVDGLPATGKDANYHGYGMKSIRSIVEKYNGSMTVKVQDGWFELRILLPLQNPEPDKT